MLNKLLTFFFVLMLSVFKIYGNPEVKDLEILNKFSQELNTYITQMKRYQGCGIEKGQKEFLKKIGVWLKIRNAKVTSLYLLKKDYPKYEELYKEELNNIAKIYLPAYKTKLIKDRNILYCIPMLFILNDILNLVNELNKIEVLESNDMTQIRKSHRISSMLHALSFNKLIFNIIANTFMFNKLNGFKFENNKILNKIPLCSGVLRIIPQISSIYFFIKDRYISNYYPCNSCCIVKDNSDDIQTQTAWLVFNKFFPYYLSAFSGAFYKNTDILLDDKFIEILIFLRSLSSISEIVRKYFAYNSRIKNIRCYRNSL